MRDLARGLVLNLVGLLVLQGYFLFPTISRRCMPMLLRRKLIHRTLSSSSGPTGNLGHLSARKN